MISNYIKTTLRHLWRNRLFTALNVLGLAIGISACLIIYQIVAFEFAYDKKIPDAERVYQVVGRSLRDGQEQAQAGVNKTLAPTIADKVGGVELVVPVYSQSYETAHIPAELGNDPHTVNQPQQQVRTNGSYFELIPYHWLAGDKNLALSAPDLVVLTASRAKQYFPDLSPQEIFGKTILYNDSVAKKVAGIVADLPQPNSFEAAELFPLAEDDWQVDLGATSSSTSIADLLFLKIAPHVAPARVLQQVNDINEALNRDHFKKYNYRFWYELLPLPEKHFAVEYEYGSQTRVANKKVLFGLMGIAGFVLLLACINYINLGSAQLPQRAKEIGIRKTLGGTPAQVTRWFMGETFVITLLAAVCSFLFSAAAIAVFSDIIPPEVNLFTNLDQTLLFLFLLALLITLLSGFYPGWLAGRMRTTHTLKGKMTVLDGHHSLSLRKGLIVFQFIIAQVFIVSSFIVARQLHYVLHTDLGFNHEALLTVEIPFQAFQDPENYGKEQILKQELTKHAEIAGVALGHVPMTTPAGPWPMPGTTVYYQGNGNKVQSMLGLKLVDTDYLDLYGLKLLAGRNVRPSDTIREYVINETAMKAFGFSSPEEALGKQLYETAGNAGLPIAGVVADFHHNGFAHNISPMAFTSANRMVTMLSTVNIKLAPSGPGTWQKAITLIEDQWKRLYPAYPFEYRFYDDRITSLYEQELRTAKLINTATGTMILISCLGLLGLMTHTAQQRTKEIGIRKVLGASVSGIVALLSKDFVKLVCLAIVIASPIAWWAMTKWLDDFAYRIDIQWWIFAVAGLVAVVVALLTVSWQAFRAAVANPVDSLRDE